MSNRNGAGRVAFVVLIWRWLLAWQWLASLVLTTAGVVRTSLSWPARSAPARVPPRTAHGKRAKVRRKGTLGDSKLLVRVLAWVGKFGTLDGAWLPALACRPPGIRSRALECGGVPCTGTPGEGMVAFLPPVLPLRFRTPERGFVPGQ